MPPVRRGFSYAELGEVRERLTFRLRNRRMEELDLDQPAIVFWMHHPGELTRFDRLEDAVHSVMLTPSAKMFSIAWIKTRDREIEMEEIRQLERRSILSRYLG